MKKLFLSITITTSIFAMDVGVGPSHALTQSEQRNQQHERVERLPQQINFTPQISQAPVPVVVMSTEPTYQTVVPQVTEHKRKTKKYSKSCCDTCCECCCCCCCEPFASCAAALCCIFVAIKFLQEDKR